MSQISFDELTEQIQNHFAEATFQEGLSLASENIAHFPEHFALINYWRMCLAARLSQFDLTNKIFESTLASGLWYADVLLRQSPSLAAIQGDEEFERLAEISAQLREADGADIPLLVIRPTNACGKGDVGCPTIFFLHGNMDTAKDNVEKWKHLPKFGWLFAAPQSSQAMYTDSYMWTDYPTTKPEIETQFSALKHKYSVDPERLIVGGFSMGGAMALQLALTGDLPAKGFILLGPGGGVLDDEKEWQPLIDQAKGKGLRGVIWMGLADNSIPQENIQKLVDLLNQNDIPCKLQTFEGLKHAYPKDFEDVSFDALDFIFQEND